MATPRTGKPQRTALPYALSGALWIVFSDRLLEMIVVNQRMYPQPETQGRNIHWHIAVLPEVTGDHTMLRIVPVNLISNALKFTRHGGRSWAEGKVDHGATFCFSLPQPILRGK